MSTKAVSSNRLLHERKRREDYQHPLSEGLCAALLGRPALVCCVVTTCLATALAALIFFHPNV